jgi:serine/threonine protein phosphatase PrpC
VKLVAEGQTDQGRVRLNNEDNYCLDVDRGVLVVADGMGGHASGEVASKMAVDVIQRFLSEAGGADERIIGAYREEYSKITNTIGSAIRLANMAIYEAAQNNPSWRGMGTTLSAVVLDKGRLSIGHVGDSRVYLVRAGDIMQITDDHTLVREQVKRDMMTQEEADTSDMKHVLTRALGVASEVIVDLDELAVTDGDALVLCTDGLSGMVSDDDILSVVLSGDDPAAACGRLIDMANGNGGRDNCTVIVAYLHKSGWLASLFSFLKWFRR